MPSVFASIGRKFKSLFRKRRDGRRSPAGNDPRDCEGEDAEVTRAPPLERSSAQALPPRSLTPPTSREPSPCLIDPRDDIPPYLETPVTGVYTRPGSSGGGVEAPLPEASPRVLTPPRNLHSYNPNHHRAVSPSPQPSVSLSVGPAPASSQLGQDPPPSASPTNIMTGGSSYFAGAQDVRIHHQQISHTTNLTPSKTVFEYLDQHIVHGAAHNSNERCDAPACHKETRVAIRQNIMSWITHGDGSPEPKRIMWLSGPAGGGKTAIAGSVAEACKEQGLLAGTFMFSSFLGSPRRMSKRGLIVTLAYHMSQHKALHSFATQLLRALEEHRDIYHKQLKEQADCLILTPFRSIDKRDRVGWPSAIIIDGPVDEVVAERPEDPTGPQHPRTSEEDQVEILEVLLALSQSPSFPFRIFISSRPERNITTFFAAAEAQSLTLKLFLDSKYDPDRDIKLFLKSKFADIRCRWGISEAWPGEDALGRLVNMSSGQFIVPTTVIRWVENGLPQQQLDEVLQLQQEISMSRNPFASLDALYRHILLRTRNPGVDPRLVVKWIVLMNPPFRHDYKYFVSIGSPTIIWSVFLEDLEGEFNYRMEPMSSLVSIPPPHDTGSKVAFYHKSFADFLSTKARCGDDLYVDDTAMIPFIAQRILQTFKKKQLDVPFPLPDSCLIDLVDLVVYSNEILCNREEAEGVMKGFLLYAALTPGSKADLSVCDVAWWVGMILNSQFLNISKAQAVGVIYCTVHKAMECNHSTPSSPEHNAMRPARDLQCHKTCVQWRRGILTQAKELGWCVHRLEEIELNKLENVEWGQMEDLCKNVRDTRRRGYTGGCEVCLIPALEGSEDVWGRVRRRPPV